MTNIKICGITNLKDAKTCAGAGADIIGFVFAKSPRKITPEKAKSIISKLPHSIKKIGVFVNEGPAEVDRIAAYCGLDAVQLHGDETPAYCKKIKSRKIKAIRVRDIRDIRKIGKYKVDAVLLDTYSKGKFGGTGKKFDWDLAKRAKKYNIPLILSGGLTPDNLEKAILQVKPHAVDISGGVELKPGKKDAKMIKKAVAIAKSKSIIQLRRKK